ncbi:unnamed protein product [Mycetohabitans rhizoxinica HKI 454]|uniref:Uncharacterized protein n=1 Tax=Mycetohabitans rhizoxinica (strain DSM 19002 / CIP 109453 / HKI 454) TaxID=882378 RepID=E5AR28_MYCRK|nr:unnamed protein product [Mycetohabitans rhizoxinica HKI 454]
MFVLAMQQAAIDWIRSERRLIRHQGDGRLVAEDEMFDLHERMMRRRYLADEPNH